MKKLMLLSVVLGLVSLLMACSPRSTHVETSDTQVSMTPDTLAFKEEYEALNDESHPYMQVSTGVQIQTLNFEQTKEFLTNGSGVLYFGFPTCPWCRNLLPELFEVLTQNQISELHYFNPKAIRDSKKLDENWELVVETPTSPEYQWLLERLDDILPAYEGLNDSSIKRLYVPLIVVVKDGKIVGHHFNTLEEQEDPQVPLTDEQKKKLKNLITLQVFPLINEICSVNDTDSPAC